LVGLVGTDQVEAKPVSNNQLFGDRNGIDLDKLVSTDSCWHARQWRT
jgi:hypothetical protein